VIGADGVRSTVARIVDADILRERNRPCAVIYGYFHGLNLDGSTGTTRPMSPRCDSDQRRTACVFVAMPPARYESKRFTGIEALFRRVLAENDCDWPAACRAPRSRANCTRSRAPGFIRIVGPGWLWWETRAASRIR